MPIGSPQWMYASGEAAFTIDQSLRFEQGSSPYLTWTPASDGNRRRWTLMFWFKPADIGDNTQRIFGAGSSLGSNHDNATYITYENQKLSFRSEIGGTVRANTCYDYLFRDPSAWYHIVFAVDVNAVGEQHRIRFYVNGTRFNNLHSSGASYPQQSYDTWINSANPHYIGRSTDADYLGGYLAEMHFYDGQYLEDEAPLNLTAERDEDYGHWKPIENSMTYGTNGFYLNFAGGGVMSATGGTITTDGNYKVNSFTADGTFTPSADGYVEYLVVGGGGNGAGFGASSVSGGGGGAGGYRTGYLAVTGGTGYSITVGAATEDSVFSSITSAGGGNGGQPTPSSGGSGGGSGAASPSGAAGTSGQGNTGGTGTGTWGVTTTRSGGGGGSGGVGGNADGSSGGAAGAGTANSITGSSVTYAAGGEGVAHTRNTAGTAGAANTGNGGGGTGGSGGNSGGAGGSGIVILRYKFQ